MPEVLVQNLHNIYCWGDVTIGAMATNEPIFRDEDWLRQKYYGEELSLTEMAEQSGSDPGPLRYWMDKFGLERRSRSEAQRKDRAEFRHIPTGYELWRDGSCGTTDYVYVHRLLAVAEYGFDAVVDRVVHHKDNIPWDNRPDNIELMTSSEHTRHHLEGARLKPDVRKYDDPEWLREQYHERELSQSEIAEKCGVSRTMIIRRMDLFDIERRSRDRFATEETPWRDAELLEELYHDQRLSTVEIAEKLDCDRGTVTRWMKRHGIERRSPGRQPQK